MIFATLTITQYFWIIFSIPFIWIGIIQGKKKMKDTREGKIAGVKQTNGVFEWMFWNKVD